MSLFSHIPIKRPRRKHFNLSKEVKLSLAPGKLIPIFCKETIPGDSFRIDTEIGLQFAPLIAPVYHNVKLIQRFFFVPMRLIWPNFNKEFITGGPEGTSTMQIPTIELGQYIVPPSSETETVRVSDMMNESSLSDYFGINPNVKDISTIPGGKISALPFRAYQLVYNEYFRNQNSEEEIDFGNLKDSYIASSGEDPSLVRTTLAQLLQIRTANWVHDYFTSTLPWTQRGAPVTIPIDTEVGVKDTAQTLNFGLTNMNPAAGQPGFEQSTSVLRTSSGLGNAGSFTTNQQISFVGEPTNNDSARNIRFVAQNPAGGSDVLLNNAQVDVTRHTRLNLSPDQQKQLAGNLTVGQTGITIESLRRTARLQEWLEKNARSGVRYIEQILAHFGVKSSDARLQRPEYLGGGKTTVKVSTVMQTSESSESSSLATPGGHASVYGRSGKVKYFCEEHGYILGLMYIMPRTSYEQGIPREFSHIDRFDFYFPEFAHLGEQPVYTRELYVGQGFTNWDEIFGYTPRYAEYKSSLSSVHGAMRTTLNFWHWGRQFNGKPVWNDQFMKYNDDRRIFGFEGKDADPLWAYGYINCHAKRPMPKFGVPYL
jgi:hypothetical protein